MRLATLFGALLVAGAGASGAAAENPSSPSLQESALGRLRFSYSATGPVETPAPENAAATLLPKFEVREKPLDLTPRDIQTGHAILAEAKARYLNPVYQKTGGPLMAVLEIVANPLGGWHPNVATAMTFYAQDERLRRLKKASDTIEVYRFENPAKYKEVRELLFQSYQHEADRRPGVLQRR